MAFFIYIVSILIPVAVLVGRLISVNHYFTDNLSNIISPAYIVLCIIAFVLKKICEDEYLEDHFRYQFKTLLAFILFSIVFTILLTIIGVTAIPGLITGILYLTFTIFIIAIIVILWFLYKNAKGLMYLFTGRYL
jgi:uncharacterized membrane protein